jgi:hypothetical protein
VEPGPNQQPLTCPPAALVNQPPLSFVV